MLGATFQLKVQSEGDDKVSLLLGSIKVRFVMSSLGQPDSQVARSILEYWATRVEVGHFNNESRS
jgi:hypothetical protein